MAADRDVDVVDVLLQAASWEPPGGFALRVTAKSRSDVRRESAGAVSRPRVDVVARLRTFAWAVALRPASVVWVLRQYVSLLRH